MTDSDRVHEERVAIFLAQRRITDPDLYKEIVEKYPVLTKEQERQIQQREVPVSGIPSWQAEPYGLNGDEEEDE